MIEKSLHRYDKTILVGILTYKDNELEYNESLYELEFLAKTANAKVLKTFTQKLDYPHPQTFIGSGKLEEIRLFTKNESITTIVFNDELSATQLKNLESVLKCKIIDRTKLILDIFSLRAKTAYAITQVELAKYQYLLPRLTGMWTHLERQHGGIGLRGPGETEIETDRRIVRDRIILLNSKILSIEKQMVTQRKHRTKLVRAAIVGYTNVGKSTIMNVLSKAKVFYEDKLFATVIPTVRKVKICTLPFLLTDTVGFIRKLPTQLIKSFKSTLVEVREVEFLIHVVDISHTNFEKHIVTVEETLLEIGAGYKPAVLVFNKIDILNIEESPESNTHNYIFHILRKTYYSKRYNSVVFISAKTKKNINFLRKKLYDIIKVCHKKRFPYKKESLL